MLNQIYLLFLFFPRFFVFVMFIYLFGRGLCSAWHLVYDFLSVCRRNLSDTLFSSRSSHLDFSFSGSSRAHTPFNLCAAFPCRRMCIIQCSQVPTSDARRENRNCFCQLPVEGISLNCMCVCVRKQQQSASTF